LRFHVKTTLLGLAYACVFDNNWNRKISIRVVGAVREVDGVRCAAGDTVIKFLLRMQ
jgi:hypothetical protein